MIFPNNNVMNVTLQHTPNQPRGPFIRAMAGDGLPISMKQLNPVEEIPSGTAVYLVKPDGTPLTGNHAILRYTNELHGIMSEPGWILEGDLSAGFLGIDHMGIHLIRIA